MNAHPKTDSQISLKKQNNFNLQKFFLKIFRINIDLDNFSLKSMPAKHNPSLNELQSKKVTASSTGNFYLLKFYRFLVNSLW